MRYSEWLQETYDFKVRDFDRSKRPWFWRRFTGMRAIAVKGNRVYVRDLAKLSQTNLNDLLDHEVEHIKQQQRSGWRRFLVSYGLSRSYRMQREIPAYINGMEAAYLGGKNIALYPMACAVRLGNRYYIGRKRVSKALKLFEAAKRDIIAGRITKVADRRNRWKNA